MKSISTMSVIVVALLSFQVNASTISLSTPVNAFVNGQYVSAQATFTTETDSITVYLENLEANPRSITQNISGFRFTVSSGQTVGTLTSSSGIPRTVASDRTYTDGLAGSTGWESSSVGDELYLYVLGSEAGPAATIIGPPDELGNYSNSNGSIEGNIPHNAFIGENATFVLNVPGVTDASSITVATFEFNTSPGSNVTVPEPATLSLLVLGGLAMLRRRRR